MDFTTMFDLMNSIDSNDVLVRSSPIWRISSSDHISRLNFDFFFLFFGMSYWSKRLVWQEGYKKSNAKCGLRPKCTILASFSPEKSKSIEFITVSK
ncbi:hypothetical protein K445DRAFT_273197 [Daldinia sp. EC12]|nr:hypothetical protein K445DRAFT_273197 [Daldinia sp. EC12]